MWHTPTTYSRLVSPQRSGLEDELLLWSITEKRANSDFFCFLGITLLNFVSSGNFWYQIIQGFQGYLGYPTFTHFIPIVRMPEAKHCILGAFFTQKYNLFHLLTQVYNTYNNSDNNRSNPLKLNVFSSNETPRARIRPLESAPFKYFTVIRQKLSCIHGNQQ